MEAEKCNLPHDAHFPCGGPAPHADVRSLCVESQLRMWANVLRVRRWTSACGGTLSMCGDPSPHAELPFRRAETLLHMRRYLLGVRRLCFACGGSVLTCGDLFFKQSQPSCFITLPVLIVASTLAPWEASSAGTVTSTRLWLRKGPAWKVWLARLGQATVKTESQSAQQLDSISSTL